MAGCSTGTSPTSGEEEVSAMWEGFVPVDSSYAPPVYERPQALITLYNAGPGTIVAKLWDDPPQPDDSNARPHSRAVQLRAGDTRTVAGAMVVLKFVDEPGLARKHAAAGWRILGVGRWTP